MSPFKDKERSKEWFRDYRRRKRAEKRLRDSLAEVQPQPKVEQPEVQPDPLGLPIAPPSDHLRDLVRAEAKRAEEPAPPQPGGQPSRPLRTAFLIR